MKIVIKFSIYVWFVIGNALIYVLPSNRYSWMNEINGNNLQIPVDGSAGEKQIVIVLIIATIALSQGYIFLRSKNLWVRVLSILLVLLAVGLWILK